jgi:hypothetical protein
MDVYVASRVIFEVVMCDNVPVLFYRFSIVFEIPIKIFRS